MRYTYPVFRCFPGGEPMRIAVSRDVAELDGNLARLCASELVLTAVLRLATAYALRPLWLGFTPLRFNPA